MIAKRNPIFKLPSKNEDIKPVKVGPDEQPRSPAKARYANIAVPPFGKCSAAMEKTPGHKIPADKPHKAQAISEIMGTGLTATVKYDKILKIPLNIRHFLRFNFSEKREYKILAIE